MDPGSQAEETAMHVKALVAIAALLAVAVGLLLPGPHAKSERRASQFSMLELKPR
jgi:hypothetical protein